MKMKFSSSFLIFVSVICWYYVDLCYATCPSATYRDGDATDVVPKTPPIPTTTLLVTVPHVTPGKDFRCLMKWGVSGVCNLTEANEIAVYEPQWTDPVWWFIGQIPVTVRNNTAYKYRVSFSFKPNPANSYASGNITRISALFLNNFDFSARYSIAANASNDNTIALGPMVDVSPSPVSLGTPNQYTNGSTWQYYEAYITSPVLSSVAQVGLRVEMAKQPSTATSFLFKNYKLDILPVVFPAPTLLTRDSESVTLPKPPTALDPNPRGLADCPHLQSGLRLWHDPSVWVGGVVPSPSTPVVLPANTKILVSSCSFEVGVVYESITVPLGSELIFDDANITLWVKDILVLGKLSIGGPSCRLFSFVSISFFGPRNTADRMGQNLGQKGIGVGNNGSLDIHGKQFHPTWARLATTAYAGDDRVYLLGVTPNWEVGQQVLLTTTSYADESTKQNEVMTIAAILGGVVSFTCPLQYTHWASLEYQGEVGLLSRRIVLQGEQISSDAELFGGHVIVRGQGRVSGTQFLRMGQQNLMARYPFHWHMLLGSCANCYARDNTFTKTYYRCISVHGTFNAEVSRNVAFDVWGHCFYLEDGIEENNTISYNLAAYIHPIFRPAAGPSQTGEIFQGNLTSLLIPADTTAGGFYFTNAYNNIYGNAASGGWAGYSFPNLFKPIGPSAMLPFNNYSNSFNPSSRPTLIFDGNTVHSAGYFWGDSGCIYCGGNLWVNYTDNLHYYNSGRISRVTKLNGVGVWMRFTNTKAFLCRAGVAHWGDKIEVDGFEGHDVARSALLFGDTWLNNGIVTGRTYNPTNFPAGQGFQFYDTSVKSIVTNMQFRRYFKNGNTNPQGDNRVIISMTHSDQFKPQGISATNNITYRDVDRRQIVGNYLQNTGSSRYYNFVDFDGSLTLRGYPVVVGTNNSWWYVGSDCQLELDWAAWVCPKTTDRIVGNLAVEVPGLIDASIAYNFGTPAYGDTTYYVGNSSLFGNGIPAGDDRGTTITRNVGITGVANRGWYLYFNNGSPLNIIITPSYVPYNNYILVAISYPSNTLFNVSSQYIYWSGSPLNFKLTAASSLADLKAANGTKYYFNGSHLYLNIVDRSSTASTSGFARGGAYLYQSEYGYRYNIQAGGCTVAQTTGTTNWCSSSYDRPIIAFN